MVLMTIPISCEKGHLLEFAFGSQPIIKLIACVAVPLEINLICAAPDFLVTWFRGLQKRPWREIE
jgi:hypothetical protein